MPAPSAPPTGETGATAALPKGPGEEPARSRSSRSASSGGEAEPHPFASTRARSRSSRSASPDRRTDTTPKDPPKEPTPAERAGFRFGNRGSHSSRTIMLAELGELLAAVPPGAPAAAYAEAILAENALGKPTAAARRHDRQHLRELYGCDPRLPIFRVLRRLWPADEPGRPLLALLTALARDPVLRATAPAVLPLPPGAELVRAPFLEAIRRGTEDRFNDAVLDKVARNAASSWSQSGHLEGRMRKLRRRVEPTPGALALAVWLGEREGAGGPSLLSTPWARTLDRAPGELRSLAAESGRLGLLEVRSGGGVLEIRANRLDPLGEAR